MFRRNQPTAEQIEEYKLKLAAQVEARRQQDINEIKSAVIKELKEYIDEVVAVKVNQK